MRYINRWDLEKADPSAEMSPPKKPIVFWLEKTIPFKYRKPIRDGILEWNKAFEKAGFYDAIEVRQQPDDADLGSGRHSLQHVPLDHGRRRLRDGPVARESDDRPDSRRRHHLRCRLPAVLEAGIRDVHAVGDRRNDRRAARPEGIQGRAEADARLHAGFAQRRIARATC